MTLPLSPLSSKHPPFQTNSTDISTLDTHLSSWSLPINLENQEKLAAAIDVVHNDVDDGMIIGLGSGSTALLFVRYLAFCMQRHGWSLQAIATSKQTHALAQSLHIPLFSDQQIVGKTPDLVVDGTDEITLKGDAIKGGGACVLREKIIAMTAQKMIIIAGQNKLVESLGAFALPIVIKPFGMYATAKHVDRIVHSILGSGIVSVWRKAHGAEGSPHDWLTTDDGDYILDLHCAQFDSDQARSLCSRLEGIPGVVTTGLFLNIAHEVIIASSQSAMSKSITSAPQRLAAVSAPMVRTDRWTFTPSF